MIYNPWFQDVTKNGKWPFIVDLPIKNGDFPVRYVKLPEMLSVDSSSISIHLPADASPMIRR